MELWNRIYIWRSLAFLAGGSLWDALTLTRIDRWSDQAFITAYQVIFVVTLILDLRWRETGNGPRLLHKYPNMLRYISQFALGSLLSCYCIYYFRGAASHRAVFYGVFLVALLIANEFLSDRLHGAQIRLAVLAFALFNGLVFAIPIWTGWLVPPTLVALLALALTAGVTRLATTKSLTRWQGLRQLFPSIMTLAAVMAMVYANILPPLPLSLERVGVFRDIQQTEDGLMLTWERNGTVIPWRYDRELHWVPGQTTWCFTSVFAPRGMELTVLHLWEKQGPDGWTTVDTLDLDVVGGRDKGFRTWTRKQNLSPGEWRVRIVTEGRRELGRISFTVIEGPPERALKQTKS